MDEIINDLTDEDEEKELSERERRTKELEESFSYKDYHVVRKELFAHLRDPAIVVRPDSVTFNQSCIDGLPDVVYIRMSVNKELRRVLVEPCDEDAPHALRWCVANGGKRKSRKLSGVDFSNLLYSLMKWDADIRYKALGFRIKILDHMAYVFLLDAPEQFDITKGKGKKKNEAANNAAADQNDQQKEKPKQSHLKGRYADEVLQSFGVPVEQYERDTAVVNTNGFVQIAMLTGDVGQEGT